MNSKLLVTVALLVIFAAGGWYFYQGSATPTEAGEYAYMCENGSQFSMTPSENVAEITLFAGSQGMFTGKVTVHKMGDGNHYETTDTGSTPIVFSGAGEEVSLTVGNESTVCNPIPNTEMAPWNWGDAGEGGGTQQDVALIVGESIVGNWQSAEDAKFTRRFNYDYEVVDRYQNEIVSTGTFKVFTAEKPVAVQFPLESNAVYVQITMQSVDSGPASQPEILNFKVAKITPEELELTYMDRGGVLRFIAVE